VRTRFIFFGALTLTAVLTACGGGGSTTAAAGPDSTAPATTSAGAGTNGANGQAQRQAYAQCLQQHGVTAGFGRQGGPPTSNTTGTTIDPNVMAAARQACASLRPTGGFGAGFGGANNPANQAYFQCLRQHGVTFPSAPPTTAAGSTAGSDAGRPRFNPSDPSFQAAQQACASLRPQRGNGTTTTTG
jgi:hypothetical protein